MTDRYVTLGASSFSVGAALLMEVVRVLMSIKKKGTSLSHVKLCCAVLCCAFVIPSNSDYNKRTDQLLASTEPKFDGWVIVTALRQLWTCSSYAMKCIFKSVRRNHRPRLHEPGRVLLRTGSLCQSRAKSMKTQQKSTW